MIRISPEEAQAALEIIRQFSFSSKVTIRRWRPGDPVVDLEDEEELGDTIADEPWEFQAHRRLEGILSALGLTYEIS